MSHASIAPPYRLIAITPPDTPVARLVEGCRAAAGGGATAVQVRAKGATPADLLRLTEALIGAVDVPVYVNDRADVARAAAAYGVHLGAEDLPLDGVEEAIGPSLALGVSVGSDAEAAAVRAVDAQYWSVGPYHGTPTKPDAGSPLGPEGFRHLAALAPPGMPTIAIGGIDQENLAGVLQAGAAGVAVIGAIFGADDVARATRRLRDLLDEVLG